MCIIYICTSIFFSRSSIESLTNTVEQWRIVPFFKTTKIGKQQHTYLLHSHLNTYINTYACIILRIPFFNSVYRSLIAWIVLYIEIEPPSLQLIAIVSKDRAFVPLLLFVFNYTPFDLSKDVLSHVLEFSRVFFLNNVHDSTDNIYKRQSYDAKSMH